MSFARWTFRVAGVYGLVLLVPQLFFENLIFTNSPPPLAHPEYFYGFLGVAVAWQVAFLMIAQDPVRYRPFMLPSVLEKISFASAAVVLFAKGRAAGSVLGFGLVDLALGVLFVVAFRRTASRAS